MELKVLVGKVKKEAKAYFFGVGKNIPSFLRFLEMLRYIWSVLPKS
jgi:hypothetical protein